MVTDPTTLAVYAALAENVYRRDSNKDQALSVNEIGVLTGVNVVARAANSGVIVAGQDEGPLASWTDSGGTTHNDLAVDGDYYYSDRGFVGMIVEVGGKYVVVLRGTDTTLSGWGSVLESAFGSGTTPDGCGAGAGSRAYG